MLIRRFMPGLRFEAALNYAVQRQGRRRWIQVPMPTEPDATSYAALAVGQAACTLTGQAATLRDLKRATQGLHRTGVRIPQLASLGAWGRGLVASTVPPTQVWGQLADGLAGQAWLLLVQGATVNPSAQRWIWITGLEHQEEGASTAGQPPPGRLRALLALDVGLPSPWGAGFNARIAALNGTGAQERHRRTWLLRGLDGHWEAVTLNGAMTLQRI